MKKLILRMIPYFLVFCAFTLPRLGNLGQFVIADEPMYVRKSGNFYYALSPRQARLHLPGDPAGGPHLVDRRSRLPAALPGLPHPWAAWTSPTCT